MRCPFIDTGLLFQLFAHPDPAAIALEKSPADRLEEMTPEGVDLAKAFHALGYICNNIIVDKTIVRRVKIIEMF